MGERSKMSALPYLQTTAASKQLIVDGKPFLVLGAELQNSSMSNADFMEPIWPRLVKDNINTVLGAVTWEQIESREGIFNFSQLDRCIGGARAQALRLVLLWFGSFKNGLSTYVPSWVKKDQRRFPRAKLRKAGGRLVTSDILSIFSDEARIADTKAFSKLMSHLKDIDDTHQTVLMVQIENEIGILGDSRDGSTLAEQRFHEAVPKSFVQKLLNQWDALHPCLRSTLQRFKECVPTKGEKSWPELFGDSPDTDQLFMAFHYSLYTDQVASAGKKIYPLPLYTNVWQNYSADDGNSLMPVAAGGGDEPGVYPSGGGVIDVLDVWQMMAPALDFVAPDIYLNDYAASCARYRHRNQPLFIPEQRRDEYGARRIWTAFGSFQAIGTSPFGIDTVEVEHRQNPFKRHYGLLKKVSQHVLTAQRDAGSSFGFFFDELPSGQSNADPQEAQTFTFGEWELKVERSFVFGRPSAGSGMIIRLRAEEPKFLLIGWGFQVTFCSTRPNVAFTGLLSFEEKDILDASTGEMHTIRLLNGDETRSGRSAVMPSEDPDYGGFPISISIPAGTGIAEVVPYTLEEE